MPWVWEIEDSERLLASGRCCLNKRPLYSQYDTSMRRRGSMMSESDTIHSRLLLWEKFGRIILRSILSQIFPKKPCYSWLIACVHLKFQNSDDLHLEAGRFQTSGKSGIYLPVVTGILHWNVINHSIKFFIRWT